MSDLNAPLGKSGRKPAGAKGRTPPKKSPRRTRTGTPVAVLAVFSAVIALNAWSFVERDTLPKTAVIAIADTPPPADARTTGSVAAAAQPKDDHGVQIIYSDDKGAEPAPEQDSDQQDISEGRTSEGGPKVIVIRDPGEETVGQPLQVAHLPDDSALEESRWGELPIRSADGRRPMDIYARPWSHAGGKRIAVVIGGLGLSQSGTLHALETLPPEITLAFAPRGNSLMRWMRQARKEGHELLVQVPMEPFGYPNNDPGPQTLTVEASVDANLDNLRWALGQITNYTGIVNYLGGRLARSPQAMTPILKEVGERGLLYFNDGTGGGENLGVLASALNVPYVSGNVVIDGTQDPAAIRDRLEELEKLADINGYAIGSGSALEVTVDTVASWANEAKKRGFEIVGVSALAR
ncbi:divergent polysaccharide deacetylase family protein [Oricola sp.]|uniref:divergent polysaccharide deacetylase family protein n=1 Tax=Oricola sp. TaxID=1979950 RepID=UPI0035159AA3